MKSLLDWLWLSWRVVYPSVCIIEPKMLLSLGEVTKYYFNASCLNNISLHCLIASSVLLEVSTNFWAFSISCYISIYCLAVWFVELWHYRIISLIVLSESFRFLIKSYKATLDLLIITVSSSRISSSHSSPDPLLCIIVNLRVSCLSLILYNALIPSIKL